MLRTKLEATGPASQGVHPTADCALNSPPIGDPLLSRAYRTRFIVVMFVVCLVNFADRAVFAVLAQPIKEDLRLTDFQVGILQGFAFAVLYATLGLPIGRLAEHRSRVWIVAAATAFWSIATGACGVAANFLQLMLARVSVGIGEAGFGPPMSSLVGDQFPRERRASTVAMILLGTPIGLFTGSIVGGAVAAAFGWREAFYVLGAAGVLVALLVPLLLREPSRGLIDGLSATPSPPPAFRKFLKVLFQKRALMFVIAGGSIAGFGMTSVSQFLAVFLARSHNMSVGEAATAYGIISGLGLGTGLLVGSFGTDWLAKRDARWSAWGAALGLFAAPPIFWLAFSVESAVAAVALLIAATAVLLLFFGPTSGMIQNLLEPRMRATGSALFSMLYTLIGAGLGPTFVGFMSDRLAELSFPGGNFLSRCPAGLPPPGASDALAGLCLQASATGIRHGLMLSVCVFFIAALLYLLAARTLAQDFYQAPEGNAE